MKTHILVILSLFFLNSLKAQEKSKDGYANLAITES